MRAEIISIGSELVSGQSLDTNSQWLSQQLGSLGISVAFTRPWVTISTPRRGLRGRMRPRRSGDRTGGLGPTQDDLTREALAESAGEPLVEDPDRWRRSRRCSPAAIASMTERNRIQALFPEGAEPLPNPIGTAPGIWMRIGRAMIACLPGRPLRDEADVPGAGGPAAAAAGLSRSAHRPSQDQPLRQG